MILNLYLPKQIYTPIFLKYITAKTNDFIETHDNGEVSDSTLCEKLKVIIRGDIISYMSAAKKERE